MASVVLDEPEAVHNRAFVEGFDLHDLQFDEDDLRKRWATCRRLGQEPEPYAWPFPFDCLEAFRVEPAEAPEDCKNAPEVLAS
jgi:hypothetical protein